MMKIVLAVTVALLYAGMLLSPAAADGCGDTYTVQHLDNLSKIAAKCGTTVGDILARNPQIVNPNVVYSGQVLQIRGGTYTAAPFSFTYTVVSGDTIDTVAAKFVISVDRLKAANPVLWTTSALTAGQVLYIPYRYITASGSSVWFPQVTLSTISASDGDVVAVYVSGFPAHSWIDVWVGQKDRNYSVVYDGTVASDGTATVDITLPSAADVGETWVIFVTTTSQKEVVEAYSPDIEITY